MLQTAVSADQPVRPKPDAGAPKRDNGPPNPNVPFDDRPLVAVGSLGFGVSIPLLTGLYGPITAGDPRAWVGFIGFIVLAATIWLGNRWLLFKQREHFDWFNNPWRKLGMLVMANVLFTAPVTTTGLWLWFRFAGLPVDMAAIQLVTLSNVICVVFVTHAYETVFLIRERESDLIRVERLERMRAQAELDALKAQIDPHFLFNSLNTLGHLIQRDALRGREFCDTLAEVYRYVLAGRSRDLVPLADEMAFVTRYQRLLDIRFGAAIALHVAPSLAGSHASWMIPPLALQTLLENAVKHNQLSAERPLTVRMALLDEGAVEVQNAVSRRSSARASSGLGLHNLDERCRLLIGQGLVIQAQQPMFSVRVPLRPA